MMYQSIDGRDKSKLRGQVRLRSLSKTLDHIPAEKA
jgi:hypothetical protein